MKHVLYLNCKIDYDKADKTFNQASKMSQTESMSISEQDIKENNPEMTPENQSEVHQTHDSSEQSHPSAEGEQETSDAMHGQEQKDGDHAEEAKHEHRQNVHQHHFQKFLSELEKLPDTEAKLQHTIEFMKASLAQAGAPHFKSFWEARTLCLNFFKENISPALRGVLWTNYNELSKEARRLKDILDEQSAFAVEQIEIAVKALENDILAYSEHLENIVHKDQVLESNFLAPRIPFYAQLQHKLSLLNTYSSRINALRKELIRTEMRVRQKNKFFQRLSLAGDKVFPVRKELIKEVSDAFMADVDAFIEQNFSKDDYYHSLFSLREEIKSLQNIAKILTLNTHSFTHTRKRLSECWDKIKGEEKERKKERAQKRDAFKQIHEESIAKLKNFSDALASGSLSTADANKQIDELGAHFRSLDISRDERQTLKEAWMQAKKPLLDIMQQEELTRLHQDQERDNARRKKIADIKQEVVQLIKNAAEFDADTITAQRDAILEQISSSHMSKIEKIEIERQLKPIRDLISEKKESSLLKLSEGDRESLQGLKEVLRQRKERRQEIKDQIDALRKAAGSSGLDFEQALNQTAQLNAEKERLEKINQGITEIEEKIARLIDN